MKIIEIEWEDGKRYEDEFGKIWTVSQKELRRKTDKGKTQYITDGMYALGLILTMEFKEKKATHCSKDSCVGIYCDMCDDF